MCKRLICSMLLLAFGLTIGVASGQSTVVRINFQSTTQGSREVPVGYLPDYGDIFDDRGNGWSYGWSVDKTGSSRDRDSSRSPDQRYDTLNDFVHWQTGTGFWEIALPNNTYNVYIISGDPGYLDQTNSYDVEGTILTDLTPQPQLPYWDEYKVTVTVADGHLTVAIAPGADPKICFIHIADVNVAQLISPPDRGLYQSTSALLTWTPGLNTVQHDVYLGTNFNDVNNANTFTPEICKGRQDPNSYSVSGLMPGATYYWRIDEVNGANVWKGDIWAFTVQLLTAYDPQPFEGEIFVDPNVVLSWSNGATAANHIVYFDDNYDGVRDATTTSPEYRGTQNADSNSWDPPGSLSLNKTYYWRIDERESDGTVHMGAVWSFTTATRVGGGVKGRYYNNSTFTEPPTLTRIDFQIDFDWGLDSPDPNITNVDDFSVRWTGEIEIPASGEWTFWVQVEHGVRLWVNGQLLIEEEPGIIAWYSATITLEAGFYPIMMEYYEIGNIALARLFWQGPLVPTRQIIPSGAFTPPFSASNPNPADGATEVRQTPTLRWDPGDKAAQHNVYIGTDFDDVNDANVTNLASYPNVIFASVDVNNYKPGILDFKTTYYWRIDEVNDPDIWRGYIWSFTTGDYIVVDDFESYNDLETTDPNSNKIYNTWLDYYSNNTGATVGYLWETLPQGEHFAETTIVNSGAQSMPLFYDNDGTVNEGTKFEKTGTYYYSETARTFNPVQDWTRDDVKSLALWFRGYPATVGSYSYSYNAVTGGTFTVIADGADIWDTADEFHFVYKKLTGDSDIIAKVVSIDNIDEWTKAGVMIRDSLDEDSSHAFMLVTPSGIRAFQNRPKYKSSSMTAQSDANQISLPHWVRLVREFGNVFTAYHSTDGLNWEMQPDYEYVGEDSSTNPANVTMTDPVYIGLAVTSHVSGTFGQAVFSDVEFVQGEVIGEWQSRDVPSNDAGQLYIAVEDNASNVKVINHPDSNAVQLDEWTEWPIDLAELSGVNLQSVQTMYIGVGDRDNPQAGGFGKLYIDDIRLHLPRCVPSKLQPAGDLNDDCVVNYLDLQIVTDNWLLNEYEITPVVPSDVNLVAYYAFENNLLDGSGNGSHGDPCGAPIYVPGQIGSALELDGIEDYVDCGNATIFDINDQITLSVWVKTNDTGNGEHNPYVSKGDTSYAIKHYTNNSIEFFIYDGDWYQARSAVLDSSFNGVWHHLAGTYDGVQLKLYIDGILQATSDHTGSIATNTYPLYIGSNSEATDRFYSGVIDEVRIYNRVLSQSEIGSLAGKTTQFTQPLYLLLSPQDSAIDMDSDGTIDLKDYAELASIWLEELLWP